MKREKYAYISKTHNADFVMNFQRYKLVYTYYSVITQYFVAASLLLLKKISFNEFFSPSCNFTRHKSTRTHLNGHSNAQKPIVLRTGTLMYRRQN